MPKNPNYTWDLHLHDVNCQNCIRDKTVPGSLKTITHKNGRKITAALTRCVLGHWMKGDYGEEERLFQWRPLQWNSCKFLARMAEHCEDYEPMGG